jgi:hypothetical protein
MFHDSRKLKALSGRRPAVGEASAVAAFEAFSSVGVQSALLSRRLLDNTRKYWLGAAGHKDAKDVSRATAAFVNASYRDISQNAEALFEVWRRFLSSARLSAD